MLSTLPRSKRGGHLRTMQLFCPVGVSENPKKKKEGNVIFAFVLTLVFFVSCDSLEDFSLLVIGLFCAQVKPFLTVNGHFRSSLFTKKRTSTTLFQRRRVVSQLLISSSLTFTKGDATPLRARLIPSGNRSSPWILVSSVHSRQIEKFFLHIRFGLQVYTVDAKKRIFTILSALAISRNVIISDVLTLVNYPGGIALFE